MKRAIYIILGVSVVVACLVAAKAHADTPPATPPAGSNASQRLAQRKAERNVQLDAKDTKRLSQFCTVSQGKLGVLKSTTNKNFINRKTEYQNMAADLWVIIGKLKLAGKDTFQLEKQLATLTDKINNFQTVVTNYQQALDDTVVINCQADVVGFKALLDTTRLYYADLIARSKDIRSFVSDTVKTSLTSQLNDLQPANEGSQ